MNADTQINLADLHQAIIDSIRQAFPGVTVEDYPDDRRRIRTPAVLIEMTELSPAPEDDPGTGQLALEAHFEAHYIIGFRGQTQHRQIRSNVAALAHHIHQRRWGLPVAPATVMGCMRDEFEPDLDQYHVWRVEWSQIVHIGANEWIDDGVVPGEIYVGGGPNSGPGHLDEYERLDTAGESEA